MAHDPAISPSPADFAQLAADRSLAPTLVPVVHRMSSDMLTPVAAFLALAEKEPHAFLLESVEGGEKIGRYTFLGARPFQVFESRDDRFAITRGKKTTRHNGDAFAALQELFAAHRVATLPGLPPFAAGAVGYVAYDAVRNFEKLPKRAKDDLDLPDTVMMFFDRLLAFDHVKQELLLIVAADVRDAGSQRELTRRYDAALLRIAELQRSLSRALSRLKPERISTRGTAPSQARATTSEKQFLRDVRRVQEYIAAGDVFQTVLSRRVELRTKADPFSIYRALRRVNPSPYMFFLRMGKLQVAGASPEMLLKCTAGSLQYRPIAGTRPRGRDDADDARLEADLRADEKERAEHIMLVDLGRNDLGRVSAIGSVCVRDLMFVERYSHVMHLVSALEGRLQRGLTALDAFRACFPAGTLTGAPKVRAMQIIEELEPVRRGIYGGAILYADFAGNLDSCIAIRTLVMKDGKAYVQAGAGIVADSDPQREHEECLNKAKAVMRAIEQAE